MDKFKRVEQSMILSKRGVDDTDVNMAKVILKQALPSSGGNIIGCATAVINMYFLAKTTQKD